MVKFETKSVGVRTQRKIDFIDLTGEARRFLSSIDVKNGLLVVYEPHTTATVVINEMDRSLLYDSERVMDDLVPVRGDYRHNRFAAEGNAHAHIRNMLMNTSVTIPIAGGRLLLGTWQHIIFVEMDGPRDRNVIFYAIGE